MYLIKISKITNLIVIEKYLYFKKKKNQEEKRKYAVDVNYDVGIFCCSFRN